MKHRIFGLLICCFLALSISVSADAEDLTAYTLDEPGLTVSLPSDYTVLTRDIDEDDPALIGNVWTKTDWLEFMTAQSVYLAGWDENANHIVTITVTDAAFKNFNLYSDTELSDIAASFVSVYADSGRTLTKYELYRHAQTKFIKIYCSQPDGDATEYYLQYCTSYDGKSVNIIMHSYLGQISPSDEAVMKDLVDSVVFDGAPQTAEADFTPTSAFTYTDPETGAAFTVPENWVESPLSKPRKYIDVKFTSREDASVCILYGSYDLWATVPEEARDGFDRSDIKNSLFTISDAAEVFNIPSDDLSMVTYGGNAYYKATVTTTTTVGGMDIPVTMTDIFMIDNGYGYSFQFNGTSGDAYYDDFEALLNSVTCESRGAAASVENAGSTDLASRFHLGSILLGLLLTIVIDSLPIIIYRYAIRKAPVLPKKALIITILYGIFAFIVMSALIFLCHGSGVSGGGILLWSFVNYGVLVGRKKRADADIRPDAPETNAQAAPVPAFRTETAAIAEKASDGETPAEDTAQTQTRDDRPEIKYCHKCGNQLQPNSLFCDKCGAKIPEKEAREK
ncbi:MAG: zinc ribbon domain-containing protein [Oscillospiraceae bacterium]